MARKTVIHVNQHVIKANATKGEDNPPLTVKTYADNRRAYEVIIRDRTGREVARVVNRPHDPLSCGARVWIETREHVDVVTSRDADEASAVFSDDPTSLREQYEAGALIIDPESTGPGFYVIHESEPVWGPGTEESAADVADRYRNAHTSVTVEWQDSAE